MTRFFLVRHGETEWNLIGRWQGHVDVPLNQIGLDQARILADYLREHGPRFAALYSSDLARAWQTAELLGAALELAPQSAIDLREIDIGWWGGLTRQEIAARDAETLALLDTDQDLPRGGAETMQDLYLRSSAALERMAADHPGETVLIVTHGGTVRVLLGHARGNGQAVWPLPFESIGNTSVSVIERDASGWQIRMAGDTSHLAEVSRAVDVMAKTQDDAQQS
ncbi:MAG: histidine phosphatase family protein [Roseiflexaceae bacterium]|nr:histidine phosphatase family protein [Roseiflexaceae bacterium]